MGKGKRAEARCRYLAREIASQKGWDIRHPQKGGDFLEEQEIEDFLPDCGLDGSKPDFVICKRKTTAQQKLQYLMSPITLQLQ